jgi:hypothetical protein
MASQQWGMNLTLADLIRSMGLDHKMEELINILTKITAEMEKHLETLETEVKEALKTVKKFKKHNPDYYKDLDKQRQ